MTSLSHTLTHFPAKGFMPYELPTYNNMPHLSHTSLMSPLVNPFVSSNIFNLLQDEMKSDKSCTLRPFHIYDPSDPITALSVPTNDTTRNNEQSPSTQVTSSTSDSDAPIAQRNVIVRNEGARKKKELVKDEAYWERRRKNNDAAKRSRDSRRQKEDEMAVRAAVLEQENIRLRLELEHLRAETDRLRVLVLSPRILSAPTTILSPPATILHAPQPIVASAPAGPSLSCEQQSLTLQPPISNSS